ncbi:MAG: ABC transporter substrate-binding protein [Sinobacteraceae bacterium]|nr:ABC transporter substrate-binding protein [Nevskiaceae bacterium]
MSHDHYEGEATTELSRRRFLKLSAMFTAAGALPLLARYNDAVAAEPDAPLRIGYLPITDATPLLIAYHNKLFQKQGLKVDKPRMFRGWAQIVEAFLSGNVNAVHMLSPMTVWARYGSHAPSKVVAWNHINGSAVTVAVNHDIDDITGLAGTTFAIPFWYSIHNVVLQFLLKKRGLEPIKDGKPGPRQVKLVVMAPADMLPGLATGRISGYIVAEPFCGAAELHKIGKILRFTGDVWKEHACCVVQMHEKDIDERPAWTQKVVNGIVEAQVWTRQHRKETAHILSKDQPERFTPHTYETLAQTLVPSKKRRAEYIKSGAIQHTDWVEPRIGFQPYPYPSYTETLVDMLRHTVVDGKNAFLNELDPAFAAKDLVDDRFVKNAIARVGGMSTFDQPESFQRTEVVEA